MTTETTTQENSKEQEQLESENSKLQKELIDDAFYVEKQRWGTWNSYDAEGKALVTSLTEEQCISATRFYLKGRQEGFTESKSYESVVGGKL
jgi:hypothetical protein